MASDPRKRQQKLAKKSAKRKDKKHQLVRADSLGLPERFTAAGSCPILNCRISGDVWDKGIGYVLLSRSLPGGKIALAVFLLDRYCLGVKDAIAQIVNSTTYQEKFLHRMGGQFNWGEVAPEYARKLVEGGVEFARSLGLGPHADYHTAKWLFGDIDTAACTEVFEYGKDGKPCYIQGPYDTPERVRQIMNILTHNRQPGEFDYLLAQSPVGAPLDPHLFEDREDEVEADA